MPRDEVQPSIRPPVSLDDIEGPLRAEDVLDGPSWLSAQMQRAVRQVVRAEGRKQDLQQRLDRLERLAIERKNRRFLWGRR